MRLKKGQEITIYDTQVSKKRGKGRVQLIKRLIKHPDEEYWHVRFIEEDYSSFRWIPVPEVEKVASSRLGD